MNYSRNKTLFTWRLKTVSYDSTDAGDIESSYDSYSSIPTDNTEKDKQKCLSNGNHTIEGCRYCSTKLYSCEEQISSILYFINIKCCPNCGWIQKNEISYTPSSGPGFSVSSSLYSDITSEGILAEFNLNSTNVLFEELGKYLKSNFEDIFYVSPRRIELLVGDIFKNRGYEVIITKSTKDGGKDLILLNNGIEHCIIEVKRHKNTIGVELIRQLLGVQLINNHKKAKLITTSHFSDYAIKEANSNNIRKLGFELELIDAHDFIKLLSIYNGNRTLINAPIINQ